MEKTEIGFTEGLEGKDFLNSCKVFLNSCKVFPPGKFFFPGKILHLKDVFLHQRSLKKYKEKLVFFLSLLLSAVLSSWANRA